MSTRHTYTCCNTITQSHNQAPPPPHCHTPQTHTVQTACTHAQCAHEAREGWRPHTHPRPVSPSSWCLCLGRCVSLWVSVSLPEPQPLHGCPWGCGQRAERCHWGGGWRGSVPGEVGAAVPRTPPTKQHWGKGEGGRCSNRRWTRSPGCSPTPPLPSETQRDGGSAGVGGDREPERHPQRERDRDRETE